MFPLEQAVFLEQLDNSAAEPDRKLAQFLRAQMRRLTELETLVGKPVTLMSKPSESVPKDFGTVSRLAFDQAVKASGNDQTRTTLFSFRDGWEAAWQYIMGTTKPIDPPHGEEPDRDRTKGHYHKYAVIRTDGGCAQGKKHHNCEYHVLDLQHDPYSAPALRAYALACAAHYPRLADDLRAKALEIEARFKPSVPTPKP